MSVEVIALKAGVLDGWWEMDHCRAGRLDGVEKDHPDALSTIWTEGLGRAVTFYATEQVRAAYVGGWAIGVQRFMDGLTPAGTTQ